MTSPTLSIITPSYNQSEFILDTIESVKNQEYDDVEHIVVDGGSDDGTIQILEEHEDDYDLRWVSEPDRGQSHALNKGIEMADGEWIGWQNSDDYYVKGSFRAFEELCTKRPDADVFYGDLVVVDRDGVEVDRSYHIPASRFVQRYSNIMANQAAFFRKSALQKVGGIREEYHYCMDIDLFWRLTRADLTLVHTPTFLGYFRTYEEAKTGGEKEERHLEERREIQERYGVPFYEKPIPNNVLRLLALGVKAGYLLRAGRLEAFTQNPTQVAPGSRPV